MVRLYGEKENIDKENVKEFFDKRANKEVDSLMTITSFQEKENLDKRQLEESEILLKNIDFTNKKVLEIGCGLGRWAEFFHDKCDTYLGIDYAENLIELANENYKYDNCYFQIMSALDIDIDNLIIEPPFDVIFIAGVLIHLNDDDSPNVIDEINNIVAEDKIIYIRETISVMDTRLTLKDFYSEDLEVDYNAIYRTQKELLDYFNGFNNITNIKSEKVHENLNKHSETGYRYFILE